MILEYNTEKSDHLMFQLYTASKSERINKKRKRSKIQVPVFYILAALFFIITHQNMLGYTFIIVAIGWYFIYPVWEKKHYFKHYNEYVNETFAKEGEDVNHVEFAPEFIIVNHNQNETRISIATIIAVNEIEDYIFIKFEGGQNLIIPLKNIQDQKDELKTYLTEITQRFKLPYVADLKWKW